MINECFYIRQPKTFNIHSVSTYKINNVSYQFTWTCRIGTFDIYIALFLISRCSTYWTGMTYLIRKCSFRSFFFISA